ncbi:hypothetical protein ACM55F_04215 [Flavobacterium sp. XS2P12]|uniref:hypothetical protein n=1 Tax=Flavobacterium melibiosi TaxID=3398734 RepID=UPI003A851FE8
MEILSAILFILIILFLIGLPFVLVYRLIIKLYGGKKPKKGIENFESNFKFEKTNLIIEYAFMKDYGMWINLKEEERKERLMDIDVIFRETKDLLKKEMINQGFKIGSKIIDIKYFTGLSEYGHTITGFLIQNENGGEIRELTVQIDLEKMKLNTIRNSYHSSGKERYFYLKNRKGLIEI